MERLSQLLAGLPHRARLARAELPQRWHAWREGLREDPTLFWRTGVVQLTGLLLLVIILIAAAQWLVAAFAPAGDKTFVEPTPTATLYVACSNAACLRAATVTRPMDFRDWPLPCEFCSQPAVYRATRCATCNQWIASVPSASRPAAQTDPGSPSGARVVCIHCARRNAAKDSIPRPDAPKAAEDAEDPW